MKLSQHLYKDVSLCLVRLTAADSAGPVADTASVLCPLKTVLFCEACESTTVRASETLQAVTTAVQNTYLLIVRAYHIFIVVLERDTVFLFAAEAWEFETQLTQHWSIVSQKLLLVGPRGYAT